MFNVCMKLRLETEIYITLYINKRDSDFRVYISHWQ